MNTQVAFSIFKPYSSDKVESLVHCFLKEISFKKENIPGFLVAEDGIAYSVIVEGKIPKDKDEFLAIVSFQKHTFGNFAIIRNKNERKI